MTQPSHPARPAVALGLAVLLFPLVAQADDIGSRLFAQNCAACHGSDGKGNGPMAELLSVAIPDLTQLSAGNDGRFPFQQVIETIDGRSQIGAHGAREMPVWGATFRSDADDQYTPFPGSVDAELFVRGRVLSLATHLQSIQE